jgi:RimJ/RimL family protein N-acetyltransferase
MQRGHLYGFSLRKSHSPLEGIMQPRRHLLKNGLTLLIREAAPEDARAVLDYIECISAESDFLTFGPGEFELTEAEEADFLRKCRQDNRLYMLGLINDEIAATIHFSAGHRPRIRHTGELGLSVRKQYWNIGIGSLLLDALIDWARQTEVITKINLRVRTDNERALALYRRKGFVAEGTIRKEMFQNGHYFDNHWMGLDV